VVLYNKERIHTIRKDACRPRSDDYIVLTEFDHYPSQRWFLKKKNPEEISVTAVQVLPCFAGPFLAATAKAQTSSICVDGDQATATTPMLSLHQVFTV
jgi:hypothetical protein